MRIVAASIVSVVLLGVGLALAQSPPNANFYFENNRLHLQMNGNACRLDANYYIVCDSPVPTPSPSPTAAVNGGALK